MLIAAKIRYFEGELHCDVGEITKFKHNENDSTQILLE